MNWLLTQRERVRAYYQAHGHSAMNWLLTLMVLVVYALHQDFWLWHDRTLVFGILPVGLAYHAAYSMLAAVMMAVLVRFAWPGHLEDVEAAESVRRMGSEGASTP